MSALHTQLAAGPKEFGQRTHSLTHQIRTGLLLPSWLPKHSMRHLHEATLVAKDHSDDAQLHATTFGVAGNLLSQRLACGQHADTMGWQATAEPGCVC